MKDAFTRMVDKCHPDNFKNGIITDTVDLSKALVLRSGDVLVVQVKGRFDAHTIAKIKTGFEGAAQKFGVGIILLDDSMQVIGAEKSE